MLLGLFRRSTAHLAPYAPYPRLEEPTLLVFTLQEALCVDVKKPSCRLSIQNPKFEFAGADVGTGLLGRHDSFTSDEIIQGDVLSAMLSLMRSVKHKSQLAGLHVIAGLALTSEASARKLLTPHVLQVRFSWLLCAFLDFLRVGLVVCVGGALVLCWVKARCLDSERW